MRVTARLYNPPGRGEFYTKSLTLPDTNKPTSPDDFAQRSVRAIGHFWKGVPLVKPSLLRYATGVCVVDAGLWTVEWETSAYAEDNDKFKARFARCEEGCNQELFTRAAAFKEMQL